MPFFELIAIAVGLAMDAFAVSIATGIRLGCVTGRQTFRMAFHFGFFQFLMPILGWMAGAFAGRYISAFDHWVAMALLVFIGGKMVYEALRQEHAPGETITADPTRGSTLIGLAVATSIDAFAVGLSLGILNLGIVFPSIIIGVVAAAFTTIGMKLGCGIGVLFSRRMEILGGLILIGIGIKIVMEHGI
ncbi:MAG: manganese efflux pump MntP [Candidatus Latescibacterota bacterium]